MSIPEETIREIRERNDIVEIISEYISLQKKGGMNYFGLCPFHNEKTPSFSVHPERQTYHCFGCGKGGNVYTFLMDIERIEFPDAVRRLGERVGIDVGGGTVTTSRNESLYRANDLAVKFFRHHLKETSGEDAKFAREYLRKRGIDKNLEEKFELGLSQDSWDALLKIGEKRGINADTFEKAGLAIRKDSGGWYDRFRGRLMFPIRNAGGKVVAFGGRILHEDPQRPAPKYLNSPETDIYNKGSLVYGLPQARDNMRAKREAIIVEGYTDLISLHMAGFDNAVATLGTALTSDQAALIKRFAPKVIILYDADLAGSSAAFRGADVLISEDLDVKVASMPEGEDPDTLIRGGGVDAMQAVLDKALDLIDFKLEYFRRQGRYETPQGRGEATRALIDTLRRIPDRISRQYAIHDAAQKLGVDERILFTEMNKVKQAGNHDRRVNTMTNLNGFDRMLLDLLLVAVRKPETRSSIFNSLEANDTQGHPLYPVFRLIEDAWEEGEELNEADIFNTLSQNESARNMFQQAMNRPDPDDESFVSDVIAKTPLHLRIRTLRKSINVIREQMKTGNPSTDLLQEYQEYQKELRQLENELNRDEPGKN